MNTPALVDTLVDFVRGIGIPVHETPLEGHTAFPGLDVRNGVVLLDRALLIHPGNILHEAGHLAVADPSKRDAPRLDPTGGEELSALAWSYAAVMSLQLPPELVFYPGSYQDGASGLLENFSEGRYIGVPLLQKFGMALEPRAARERGLPPFPHMLRWLR